MLGKNWNIITTYSPLQPIAMPPSKTTALFRKNRHPKFGDTWETILMAPLQSVFCARTTQPKVTPTNHHLLIDIHHRRFSLGHQGLPRLHQSLEKPPASTPQEGVRRHGEGGGGKEVQGSLSSEKQSLSNCCLTTCPPWNSWRGGSITIHESQFPLLAKLV